MPDFKLREILLNAFAGVNTHIKPINVLEDLDIEISGKEIKNSPYTIWQILKHINYWQEKFISYVKDETTPSALTAKEGWAFSKSPLTEEELKAEIKNFSVCMDKAINFTDIELNKKAQRYKSGYDVLQSMSSHISYHIGEIVLLRRITGNWPPPSGGDTW